MEIYGGLCFWCAKPMKYRARHDPNNATADELLPRSRGGKYEIENQVPAHNLCNIRRGNMVAPQSAFARHHGMLRKHNLMPERKATAGVVVCSPQTQEKSS